MEIQAVQREHDRQHIAAPDLTLRRKRSISQSTGHLELALTKSRWYRICSRSTSRDVDGTETHWLFFAR